MMRTTKVLLVALVASCGPHTSPATSTTTTAPSVPFRVTTVGHGPPILFIPGLSSPGAVWDHAVAQLSTRYTCHVFTLAGFAGQPALPGESFLPVERDAILAYIHDHQLEHPVLVGHSLGGFLAYGIAAASRGDVAGVLAIDGVPFLPVLTDPTATATDMQPQAAQLRTMLAGLDRAQFTQQTNAALAGMITKPEDVERIAADADRSDPRIVAQAVYEIMTTDLRPQLPAIHAPVWLIEAGNLPGMPEAYAAQIATAPDHRLVVAATARHFVMLDDPAIVEHTLGELLAKVHP